MTNRIGQQLGNYQLLRPLGRGGFAEVYLGQHIHLSAQQAAIKILKGPLHPGHIEAFKREANIIATLKHPHIVQILDFNVIEDTPFLVMDYAPNGSMRQKYPRKTRFSSPQEIIPLTATPTCGGAFSDNFPGHIDSRWTWIHPNNDDAYNVVTAGSLSISAPPNSDINPSTNFNAPRLLQSINGDFTVQTQIDFNPNTFFQSAGILIWLNQNNFLRFERGYNGVNGVLFQKDENGTFSDVTLLTQDPTPATLIELRVQRQGDHFTAEWRAPGQNWQMEGETDVHFSTLLVGIDVLSTFNAPLTTATFDYFTVSCT